MKVHHLLNETASSLSQAGFSSPALDAEVLLMEVLGASRTDLYLRAEREVSPEEQRAFGELVKRRLTGEPVAYLSGRREFWSLDLEVGPAVLVPRPETEILVEEVLRFASGTEGGTLRIADVGTGSGAVALALAGALERVQIVATDVSREALAVASRNARRLRVQDRVSFLAGDLLEPLCGSFDCIVSNPPYLSEGEFSSLMRDVREFEPREALVAGREGTEMHRRLIGTARMHLRRGGRLFLEIGPDQKTQVEALFLDGGYYGDIRFRRDYGGLWRVASAAHV
ncbi:MAG TPA: peptide chain release factor N(5)-glutamine methyltransferase [Syntrophales bacterium]|nr:peptide chain release factor N(5)-glutamine methyltransferase [Syntrophales bacterium]